MSFNTVEKLSRHENFHPLHNSVRSRAMQQEYPHQKEMIMAARARFYYRKTVSVDGT